MNINKFGNYLLSLLLGLQLINYILLFVLWVKFSYKGLIVATVLLFVINLVALWAIQKVTVYDDAGSKKSLDQIFADIFDIVIILVLSTIIGTILAGIIGYRLALSYGLDKGVGLFIPFLAAGILYGSIIISVKMS